MIQIMVRFHFISKFIFISLLHFVNIFSKKQKGKIRIQFKFIFI